MLVFENTFSSQLLKKKKFLYSKVLKFFIVKTCLFFRLKIVGPGVTAFVTINF